MKISLPKPIAAALCLAAAILLFSCGAERTLSTDPSVKEYVESLRSDSHGTFNPLPEETCEKGHTDVQTFTPEGHFTRCARCGVITSPVEAHEPVPDSGRPGYAVIDGKLYLTKAVRCSCRYLIRTEYFPFEEDPGAPDDAPGQAEGG